MTTTTKDEMARRAEEVATGAMRACGPNEHWPDAVDAALETAGIGLGPPPDGTDPWAIAVLADGTRLYYDEETNSCLAR